MASGGHFHYAVHALALVAAGRIPSLKHLWRQRLSLPPQPLNELDTAATTVAQAVWARDDANAHKALENSAWGEPYIIALAEAAASALRERAARNIALAFSRISSAAVANSLCISVSDVGKLGWPTDNDGYLVPPNPPSRMGTANGAPTKRVAELANQLVRLQTTGTDQAKFT